MLRVLKTKTELEQLAQTGQAPALTPVEERWRPGPSTRPAEDGLASAAVSQVRDIEDRQRAISGAEGMLKSFYEKSVRLKPT